MNSAKKQPDVSWRRKLQRAKREAVISSDSEDDRIDDSGVRKVILTPPRKLIEKVEMRYALAERKLDAVDSARALQHTPPKRRDHYTKAQSRVGELWTAAADMLTYTVCGETKF
jgi:hypothetical protein